jgi:tetratricopeptide (TPR) repeat protein
MLGREQELDALRKAFRRVVRGKRCALVSVLGPAGIGKSRLAEELRSSVADRADVLVGRCLSYGDGITFWPLAEVLVQALGEDVAGGVEGLLADRVEGGQRAARLVAAALGLAEGGAGREETFWAVRMVLEALAARRPAVLVFDDVHWAEPTFLELLDHLVEVSSGSPLLVVCLARPELLELRPAWRNGNGSGAAALELEPLSDADSRLLISNLLGGKELPGSVADRITTAAEGNPLYVEHLLGMLVDDGLLQPEDGRWVAANELPELRLPPTIEALVAARLDRLPREERDVIEAAAVVGKVFSTAALAALARESNREAVEQRLDALVRKGLIAPERGRADGEPAFRFQHLLIRESAYHSLPKRGRAGLHERLADWLERSEAGPELDELIGYHLEQAHRYRAEIGPLDDTGLALAPRAGVRLGAAGRRAFAHGDVPAAVNLLARAAALLPDGHPERPAVLLGLADAVHEAGDTSWAESVLEEVQRIADATGDRRLGAHADVLRLRMQILFDPAVTTEQLLRGAERNVEVFEKAVDHDGLAKAWFVLAWIPWLRCQAAMAERALERAGEHARAAGDERAYADAENLYLGAALQGPTPVAEAVARCEAELASPETPQRVQACALRVLAVLRAMEGRFDEARELVARDRQILEALGRRLLLATVSEAHALVELLADDPRAAERILARGYEGLEAMGETGALSTVAALRAEAALALGDVEAALRHSEASERAAAPEDFMSQVLWRRPRAKVLAVQGEAEEAERTARRGVELARRTDFPGLQAEALIALAEILSRLGRGGEAVEPVEEAIRLLEAKGDVVSTKRARKLLAELPAPVSARE